MSSFGHVVGVFHWKIVAKLFLSFIAGEWHQGCKYLTFVKGRLLIAVSTVKEYATIIYNNSLPGPVAIPD